MVNESKHLPYEADNIFEGTTAIPSLTDVITLDEFDVASNEDLDCMRSQLVAEYLMDTDGFER